jgi:hypothetical protein
MPPKKRKAESQGGVRQTRQQAREMNQLVNQRQIPLEDIPSTSQGPSVSVGNNVTNVNHVQGPIPRSSWTRGKTIIGRGRGQRGRAQKSRGRGRARPRAAQVQPDTLAINIDSEDSLQLEMDEDEQNGVAEEQDRPDQPGDQHRATPNYQALPSHIAELGPPVVQQPGNQRAKCRIRKP